jgi:alternate signal-mediated exported protein
MNNKTKGVIAGIAGITLLAGGSTFALWSDSDAAAGGTIVNGDLDVKALGALAWQDVSGDRTDSAHDIDLATWKMVPGDTITGTQALDVALLGDNLSAELSLSKGTADTLPAGVTVTYDVTDGVGNVIATGTTGTGVGSVIVDLQSPDNANPDPDFTTVGSALDTDADLKVVVRVTFDASARVSTLATSTLTGLSVNLTQVRNAGPTV